MTAPTPKTKAQTVLEDINNVVTEATHYLAPDDWNVRRLLRLTDELIRVEPATGHSAKGGVYQLTGDVERVNYHDDNAIALAPSDATFDANKCSHLSNLGFFSEAQKYFDRGVNPERGKMTQTWHRGYLCGAFQTMVRHLDKARNNMKLDLEGLDTDTAERAAKVLGKRGASDSDVAEVLDLAGQVLRADSLFFVGPCPCVGVFDHAGHEPFVEITFDLDASTKQVHELYRRFVDLMTEELPATPSPLSVVFRPWKRQHERSAA
jgi:Tfp pilus assembly protein PilF